MTEKKTRVILSFDLDAETLWTSRGSKQKVGPVELSQGIYGPEVGIPRILELLGRHDVPATFFITGYAAEKYPEQCRQIVDEGHEIGHHNFRHEWPNRTDEKVEREAFARAVDTLRDLTGKRPTGYRAPGWEFSDITFDLLREYGFSYSSNMMDREETGIVELPCSWLLDDAAFFMHGLTYDAPMFTAQQVFDQWRLEFDAMSEDYAQSETQAQSGAVEARRQGGRGVYVLTMHPQIIGRPSRARLLGELIEHIGSTGKARFCRADEAAEEVMADADRRRCDYRRYN